MDSPLNTGSRCLRFGLENKCATVSGEADDALSRKYQVQDDSRLMRDPEAV